jgi:DNA-binding transcriptional MerR regulator
MLMPPAKPKAAPRTYPLRTVVRLTGLKPELLRAWERRYEVVEPLRTPGGTRRYRAEDVERLRLLKAAVDAGHRIGQLAGLDDEEIERRVARREAGGANSLDEILSALDRLDAPETHRLLAVSLAVLGPVRFAREVALPLVREVGARWADGRMDVASEHLATYVLRSLLGSAMQPAVASLVGPRILFTTPPGERHELGLQMAALAAMGAGANPIYLGAELPLEDLLAAAARAEPAVVALGIVALAAAPRALRAIRAGLPPETQVWVGGSGAAACRLPEGIELVETLEDLENRVRLLAAAS